LESVVRRQGLCAAVFGSVLAGGCAGTPAPLTAAQLVQRADAICRQAGHPYAGARPTEPAAFLSFLQAQLPAQEHGLTALEALKAPADGRGAWSSQVLAPECEQLADGTEAAAKLTSLIGRGDRAGAYALVLTTANRLDARGAGINRYWTAAGATSCLDSPL